MNEKDFEKLVFGMAHQIRNPCAIIRSNANLILEQPGLKPETVRSLEAILNGAKYLEERLDEFVEFSKPLQPSLKEISAAKLLNELRAMLAEKCKIKKAKILCKAEENLVFPGDRGLILVALLNVALNAVEAVGEGGDIQFTARALDGELHLEIRDNGMGIHPRDLIEAFSPFYSTKAGGLGIGLAVAKKMIEAHRGKIEIQSEQNKGTRVGIRLPLK